MFKCSSCDYTSEIAGQCPTCNVELVEEQIQESQKVGGQEGDSQETPAA